MIEVLEDEQPREIVPKDITLYWMSGDLASWKIRIALEEKQLQGYESILVVRSENIAKDDRFWKGNEDGIIPSLRIEDITLNGVLPALLFLETSMPSRYSAHENALVLERAFESSNFQRVCFEEFIGYCFPLNDSSTSFLEPDQREKRERTVFDELRRWNDYLATGITNGIAHASFTVADVLFFPELALAARFGLSLTHFPRLNDYYETLCERLSIRKTWPYHWRQTAITYDWLSNIHRFCPKPAPIPIVQNTDGQMDNLIEASEELRSVDSDVPVV